jgi:hypothetical protein
MGQFDFLHEDSRQPDWNHEPIEQRETGLFDHDGKRIGFQIHRSVRIVRDNPPLHHRSVLVTKDGEWQRNDHSSFHATREEAEEEVERRIGRSIARYARIAADRDVVSTSDFDFTRQIRINTSRGGKTRNPSRPIADQLDDVAKGLDGCGKNMAGCGCLLVILGGGTLLLLGIL